MEKLLFFSPIQQCSTSFSVWITVRNVKHSICMPYTRDIRTKHCIQFRIWDVCSYSRPGYIRKFWSRFCSVWPAQNYKCLNRLRRGNPPNTFPGAETWSELTNVAFFRRKAEIIKGIYRPRECRRMERKKIRNKTSRVFRSLLQYIIFIKNLIKIWSGNQFRWPEFIRRVVITGGFKLNSVQLAEDLTDVLAEEVSASAHSCRSVYDNPFKH